MKPRYHKPARIMRDQTDAPPSFDDVEVVQTNGRMLYIEDLTTGERDWIAPADLRSERY